MHPRARRDKLLWLAGPTEKGIVLDKKNEVGRDSRLPKPIGKEASGKRLVLGFDGGCSACGELARRIGKTTSKFEVCSLHEPRVEEWRKKALGQDLPLVPTLFEVGRPEEVRAWTGWRLGPPWAAC